MNRLCKTSIFPALMLGLSISLLAMTNCGGDEDNPVDPGGNTQTGPDTTGPATGLESGTTYYFALKTSDEVPNESGLSNCCHEVTIAETHPPADTKDLKATAVDATSFELTWTAPGDDYMTGTATRYDIRYSMRPITSEDEWDRALVAADPPSPKPAGEGESFTVTGLMGTNYFFAVKTVDELDNWSGISNLAIGLGFDEILWAFPSWVSAGERMYIAFRAAPSDLTQVSLNNWFYWFEDRACGSKLVMDIVRDTLTDGVYTITFDFIDPDTGQYLPIANYEIFLCYGPHLQKYVNVGFN